MASGGGRERGEEEGREDKDNIFTATGRAVRRGGEAKVQMFLLLLHLTLPQTPEKNLPYHKQLA